MGSCYSYVLLSQAMICWTALTAVAYKVIICFVALEFFVTSGQS